MPMITTSNLPSAIQFFYDKTKLSQLLSLLVYNQFGQTKTQPKGSGLEMKFRRYDKMAAATTPLTEGMTPLPGSLTYVDVSATLSQYGNYVPVTDIVELANVDPVLTDLVEQLGLQEALTIDTILRNQLLSGTNVQYANSVADRASIAAKLAAADIQKIVRTLKGSDVPQVTSIIKASTGIGTLPIAPSYIGITHTDSENDLRALESSGFVPVEKYAAQTGIMKGEIGSGWGVRFIATTQCPVLPGAGTTPASGVKGTGSKTDVYQTLIFGADAFARIQMTNGNSGTIIKREGGTSDPLNQRTTAGKPSYAIAA